MRLPCRRPRGHRAARPGPGSSHAQGDRPELAVTGADLGEAGRRTSSLTGGGAFGAPGGARFFLEGGHTVVEADDAGADVRVGLRGPVSLTAADPASNV